MSADEADEARGLVRSLAQPTRRRPQDPSGRQAIAKAFTAAIIVFLAAQPD